MVRHGFAAAVVAGALTQAGALAPANAQGLTAFERGFYETCLPACYQEEEVIATIVRHGQHTLGDGFNQDIAVERIQDACLSYCGCQINALARAHPSLEEQMMLLLQPERLIAWRQSEQGMASELQCRTNSLVQPFELAGRPEDHCTETQEVAENPDGDVLKDTAAFQYILANYRNSDQSRPPQARARDQISARAAGLIYDATRTQHQEALGLAPGQGRRKLASWGRLPDLPNFSIILEIDNVPITSGVDQVHEIIENKRIGDDIVLCGIMHHTENSRSVWRGEVVARTVIQDINRDGAIPVE